MRSSTCNSLGAVACLADDVDVGFGAEDEAEAVADERLVVGEQDGDHAAGPVGRRARTVQPL